MWDMRWLVAVTVLSALASAGCATAATTAALRGDEPALRAALERGQRAGTATDAEAADVARVVLSRDLDRAAGVDAIARVRDVAACAKDLGSALEARAKVHDDAGAEAALALLDAGVWEPAEARRWLADPADAWRAVGTRSLVGPEDGPARRAAMLAPVPSVRRAALRAVRAAHDARDLDAIFDAARRDPAPLLRTEAVRALAASSGPRVAGLTVLRLRDLWVGADDPIREDIAAAWAMPVLAPAGGAEALRVLVASGHGPGAIAGAAAVLRGFAFDGAVRASAIGLLARTIEQGSRRDAAFALAVIPTSEPRAVEALRRAAGSTPDLDLRLAALSRLTESPLDRPAALAGLEQLGSPRTEPRLASRARLALAAAGDRRIQAWIEQDLAAADPSLRVLAALALASLGRAARGAPLLADRDPRVRARVGCTLLLASHSVR